MKYSDQQRVEKMRETAEKLLRYVEKENITSERIFEKEAVQRFNGPLQRRSTTSESMPLICRETSKSSIRIFRG